MRCAVCGSDSIRETYGQFYCSECNSEVIELSQRLTDEFYGDLDADDDGGGQKKTKTGTSRKKQEAAIRTKVLNNELEIAFAWSRSEAMRFSLDIYRKLLEDYGASPSFSKCLPAIWNLFLKNTNLDGCGKNRKHRYTDGKSAEEFMIRRLNNVQNDLSHSNPIQYVQLAKLFQLLYVSFMVSGDQSVQFFDIMRWAREDHLPTTLMSQYFPPHIRLHRRDLQRFSCSSYRAIPAGITLTTGAYLGLDKYYERDMASILKRLIVEFQLPLSIYAFITKLFKPQHPPGTSSFQNAPQGYRRNMDSLTTKFQFNSSQMIRYPEVRACAMILVALKVLFGLNDHAEFNLSALAKKLKIAADDSTDEHVQSTIENAFVFSEWYHHITYRNLVVKKIHPPACLRSNAEDVYDKMSLPVLLRRGHWLEGNAFAGQIEVLRGKYIREPADNEKKPYMDNLRQFINDGEPENGQIHDVVQQEVTAFFRPSFFPQRAIISAYLAVLPAVRKLRRVKKNKKVQAEPFLDNLKLDVLERRFTDKTLDYITQPLFGWGGAEDFERFPEECRDLLTQLEELKRSMEKSYWILSIRLKKDRMNKEVLKEKLPATFMTLLTIFADVLEHGFEDLYDECELAETRCLKDRVGFNKGRIGSRETRMDGTPY